MRTDAALVFKSHSNSLFKNLGIKPTIRAMNNYAPGNWPVRPGRGKMSPHWVQNAATRMLDKQSSCSVGWTRAVSFSGVNRTIRMRL
jgi:hypothetical protein